MREFEELHKDSIGKNKQAANFSSQLHERLLKYSTNTIRYLSSLPRKGEYEVFRAQLSRSATSIGANYEEARGAITRKEFINKIAICQKESRESHYWFKILQELSIGNQNMLTLLINESAEILKIFVASVKTAKNSKK